MRKYPPRYTGQNPFNPSTLRVLNARAARRRDFLADATFAAYALAIGIGFAAGLLYTPTLLVTLLHYGIRAAAFVLHIY